MMHDYIIGSLRQTVVVIERLTEECREDIAAIATAIINAIHTGHKLLLFGNGGSAADCQHFAAELIGRFQRERRALPAIALTVNTSILTAVANDYGYEHCFSRQIQALGNAGDIAIAISTSGRSPNILAGLEQAGRQGLTRIGLTGSKGNLLAQNTERCLIVPDERTPYIQEAHLIAIHLICDLVEQHFNHE